ncbi:5848_t:CDS:2, partial [Paraglomus brasilianum]
DVKSNRVAVMYRKGCSQPIFGRLRQAGTVLFSSLRREEGGRAELLDKLQLIEFVYLWKGLSAGNLATGPKGTLETVRERSVRATIKEQSDPCREAWRVLTYFTCYRLKVGSTV